MQLLSQGKRDRRWGRTRAAEKHRVRNMNSSLSGHTPRFQSIDATRSALLGISLQNFFMARGFPNSDQRAARIVPKVNLLATAMRTAGGKVLWLQHTLAPTGPQAIPRWQAALDPAWHQAAEEHLRAGAPGHDLFEGIATDPSDVRLNKYRASVFRPA